MALTFCFARGSRGGSFAAGPAAPVADEGITDADILAMSPVWWLDADATYVEEGSSDPVETDGDTITTWLDRSGNDRDWVQSTIGDAPHWYSSGTNSKPYVHLDADRLKWVADATYSTPMTMYFVISFDSPFTFATKILEASEDFLSTHYGGVWPDSLQISFGVTGSSVAKYYNTQSTDTQIIQLLAGGASGAYELRLDGGADEGVDAGGGAAADDDWVADGATAYFGFGNKFKAYEWIVINDVTHDQDTVFSYLGEKYDIEVEDVE